MKFLADFSKSNPEYAMKTTLEFSKRFRLSTNDANFPCVSRHDFFSKLYESSFQRYLTEFEEVAHDDRQRRPLFATVASPGVRN